MAHGEGTVLSREKARFTSFHDLFYALRYNVSSIQKVRIVYGSISYSQNNLDNIVKVSECILLYNACLRLCFTGIPIIRQQVG